MPICWRALVDKALAPSPLGVHLASRPPRSLYSERRAGRASVVLMASARMGNRRCGDMLDGGAFSRVAFA